MHKTIIFCGKKYEGIELRPKVFAWPIQEVENVFRGLLEQDVIILGGDILANSKQYTRDNWYYNIDYSRCTKANAVSSFNVAVQYIRQYISHHGTNFYVIIVTK